MTGESVRLTSGEALAMKLEPVAGALETVINVLDEEEAPYLQSAVGVLRLALDQVRRLLNEATGQS